ncbi:hypothetical protein BC941DRAFT_418628 [Chlamydoabsidia padenii]|nr:hypothetical protein BC941DRAFT_418628 [Chlamydoabsidia padenii]
MPQINDTTPQLDPSDPTTLLTRSLPLLPFQNQVGGHCSFFRFSKRAICKPMSHKEQEFYEYLEHLHAPLLPFTSQYLGVVNVTYRSTNAQPMLPEVILAENQHLLANWKKYTTRRPHHRRHSSSYNLTTTESTTGESDACKLQTSWSPLTFKEQVLREVFLPDALQERLQQVQDWQRGMRQRQLEEEADTGKRSILHTSRSVLDFRCQRLEDATPHETNSPDNDDHSCSSEQINAPQVTVHPRRPSLIDSTTSAPQTPRMRETKLHNPLIRPSNQSSIPNGSPSTLTPICLSPTTSTATTTDDGLVQPDQESSSLDSTSKSASWRPRREPTNPWSVQMYQRDLEKVNVDDMQQFILIEDLTEDIKYPCVLDLKMGTRQHGVYSDTKKMLSQTKKCALSTSLQLGVRISGMQVYDKAKQHFFFEDKYKGRSLTPHTFRDSLVRYFDNGEGCHILHLPTLIRKLALIHRIIQSMDSFRFYASSLLIIYDAEQRQRRIDVRLIDFAKSVTKHEWMAHQHEFTYPPEEDGPDQGYLLGVQSLIACFLWIYLEHGGNKSDLADLDDGLLGQRPSWLYDDDVSF